VHLIGSMVRAGFARIEQKTLGNSPRHNAHSEGFAVLDLEVQVVDVQQSRIHTSSIDILCTLYKMKSTQEASTWTF
jgi:hypothetical protein